MPVAHPRIKPQSQFNDPTTTLDNANCSMASAVMLGELATGKRLYPGQLRKLQSDQEGGTSIPDVARAWGKAYPGALLEYASADDGSPVPPRKHGSTITAQGAWELLSQGYGMVLQGVYGIFEVHGFSLQLGFKEGHAIYLDGARYDPPVPYREAYRQAYVIDPLGRAGYKGEWIPWAVVVEYGLALGRGGFYAAWAPPKLPDSSTGDPLTTISPITVATGTVTSSGKVPVYLPDGTHKSVVLTDFLADVIEYGIAQSDGRAPKGGPWRRLAARPYVGWYVPSASVTFAGPAADDCTNAVAAEHERVRADAIRAAEAL